MTMTAGNNGNSAKTVGGGLFNRYILKPSADRWAQPAAADELTSLDDHTLKDMGIARYEIPGIVAAEMAPQAAANEEDPPQPINARRTMTQSGHAPRGRAPSAEESSMSRSLILHPASRTGQRSFPMPPVRAERKLAAILAADVAGYSRLMGADEEGTLARLKAHRRELIDPKIEEHRGRIVKTTGDGILVEFPSVVDAVRCAVETQEGMVARNADVPQDCRIDLRVGVNLGDIIVEGDDIHGDGVNIAARLEGLAEPGGICISQTVLNLVSGKVPFEVEDAGEQALKNIDRPGIISAWDDPKFVAAIGKTGRKNLIMAGVTIDVCLAFAAMQAVDAGYHVYGVIDASGGLEVTIRENAVARMRDHGVTPINWTTVAAELQRDWRLPTGKDLGRVFHDHYHSYGLLMDSFEAQAANVVKKAS